MGPFENGVTRGDFVWALSLQRPDLGLGTDREAAVAAAQQQGILSGRLDDTVTRAEAAAILQRSLGLGQSTPREGVAFFLDVPERLWYFDAAHLCRQHGLFKGGAGDNLFRGGDGLGLAEAQIVIGRAVSPAVVAVADQVNGTEPLLEPSDLLAQLDAGMLPASDIGRARDEVAALPEGERAPYYRKLAEAVAFHNQRDNDATYAKSDAKKWGYSGDGDTMCNFTSIAMALEQLGIEKTGDKQFEDELDEAFIEAGHTNSQRYDKTQRGDFIEDRYDDVTTTTHWVSGDKKAYFTETILPLLEAGESATMGNSGGSFYDDNHIVRIEWVTADGVIVDDPYGKLSETSWGGLTYDKNDTTTETGDGAKGADNLWTRAWLAWTNPAYVQTYKR